MRAKTSSSSAIPRRRFPSGARAAAKAARAASSGTRTSSGTVSSTSAERRATEERIAELEASLAEANAALARKDADLRRQALELESLAAVKNELLANVSHELRTPLNAILGYTSMLLQGVSGDLAASQKRKIERVHANGRALFAIVEHLLQMAQLAAGRASLDIEEVSVGDLVREVGEDARASIVHPGLHLIVEAPTRAITAATDRAKLKQIVRNLLENALKFTPSGVIRTSVRATRGAIAITVSDTGIGISREHRDRIFEPFQQVDGSPTRRFGGTGLGLAISRRLARMLGGELAVESELGAGSTFTLTLPARTPASRAARGR